MGNFSDNKREADANNPKGYYEHERVKNLARDKSWLKEAAFKAVKVISHLMFHLPANFRYKVIFMAITSGSSAALFINSSTEVLNKS